MNAVICESAQSERHAFDSDFAVTATVAITSTTVLIWLWIEEGASLYSETRQNLPFDDEDSESEAHSKGRADWKNVGTSLTAKPENMIAEAEGVPEAELLTSDWPLQTDETAPLNVSNAVEQLELQSAGRSLPDSIPFMELVAFVKTVKESFKSHACTRGRYDDCNAPLH